MMGNFTAGELRALFEYQTDTLSNTHGKNTNYEYIFHVFVDNDLQQLQIDLLGCRCSRGKKVMQHLKQNVSVDELSTWDHNNCAESWTEIDTALARYLAYSMISMISMFEWVLCRSVPEGRISFVFSKVRDPSQDDPKILIAAVSFEMVVGCWFFWWSVFQLNGIDPMAESNEFDESDKEDDAKATTDDIKGDNDDVVIDWTIIAFYY